MAKSYIDKALLRTQRSVRPTLVASTMLLAACSSSAPPPPQGQVSVADDEISISGFISDVTVEQLRALTDGQQFSRVRVDVYDGDPLATMQIGYFIHRQQLDLRVDGACLGPCANYLFTAAASKYLHEDAVVAWFGGALAESWTQQNQRLLVPGIRHVAEQYMDAFLRREIRFFERIGVEQSITSYGYTEASGCNQPDYAGFYYSIPQLLRFGVADVYTARGDWRDAFEHYPDQFCQVDLSTEYEVIAR
ncbi:MAG: hypothetical protein JJU03_06320 [Idiomarina sp.]|nr:hypothetical protein [Idiomarina sp.]